MSMQISLANFPVTFPSYVLTKLGFPFHFYLLHYILNYITLNVKIPGSKTDVIGPIHF